MRTLINLARIRRIEFFIVELTIFLLPVLVSVHRGTQVDARIFGEAFLLFFLLYSLGDGINCLADRELDAVYKSHLSRAVYELGVPVVTGLVIAEAVLSMALALHLSWVTQKWLFVPLVVIGLFLGIGYSVKPLHFKARGVLHLLCLWLLLYFIPMLYAALIVVPALSVEVLILAASYATVEMGIILVNTAEDYPEDKEAGINTTIVWLGVRRGMGLASWMVVLGGLGFVGTFMGLYLRHGMPLGFYGVIGLLTFVWLFIARRLWSLRLGTRVERPQAALQLVRTQAKLVPLWATTVGWSGLLCAAALAYHR